MKSKDENVPVQVTFSVRKSRLKQIDGFADLHGLDRNNALELLVALSIFIEQRKIEGFKVCLQDAIGAIHDIVITHKENKHVSKH